LVVLQLLLQLVQLLLSALVVTLHELALVVVLEDLLLGLKFVLEVGGDNQVLLILEGDFLVLVEQTCLRLPNR
jgi:hypothetical protein